MTVMNTHFGDGGENICVGVGVRLGRGWQRAGGGGSG